MWRGSELVVRDFPANPPPESDPKPHLERPDLVLPKPKFLQQHQLVQIPNLLPLHQPKLRAHMRTTNAYPVPAQLETRQSRPTPVQLALLHIPNLILHQVQHLDLGQRWQVGGMSDIVERQVQ